jgi:2-hydroxychromene-2-carboxylate isomerase
MWVYRTMTFMPTAVLEAQSAAKLAPVTRTLDLYWDFSSPFAYLGATQAEALAARTSATLTWRPMLLGAVFKAIGQEQAPILSWGEAKRSYYFKDLERWAELYDVPFRFPTRFPMFSLKALRAYLALPEGRRGAFRDRTFRAYWSEDRDIADEAVLAELAGEDAAALSARIQSPEVKKELLDATQTAIDRGVFGAPTWIVDGRELFWGQDRIALVERALRR